MWIEDQKPEFELQKAVGKLRKAFFYLRQILDIHSALKIFLKIKIPD
jgi:hypothetical protein